MGREGLKVLPDNKLRRSNDIMKIIRKNKKRGTAI